MRDYIRLIYNEKNPRKNVCNINKFLFYYRISRIKRHSYNYKLIFKFSCDGNRRGNFNIILSMNFISIYSKT